MMGDDASEQSLNDSQLEIPKSRYEIIPEVNDFGTMYLLFDQALVSLSSGSILFFKIDEETGLWTRYEKFENMRGQIFFIKGNQRI